MYLAFTHMPCEGYCRQVRSLFLGLCDVLILSVTHVCWLLSSLVSYTSHSLPLPICSHLGEDNPHAEVRVCQSSLHAERVPKQGNRLCTLCCPHCNCAEFCQGSVSSLFFKGDTKQRSIMGHVAVHGIKKIDSLQFFCWFVVDCYWLTFENYRNMAVSAAVLCPKVCDWDILNAANIGGVKVIETGINGWSTKRVSCRV